MSVASRETSVSEIFGPQQPSRSNSQVTRIYHPPQREGDLDTTQAREEVAPVRIRRTEHFLFFPC